MNFIAYAHFVGILKIKITLFLVTNRENKPKAGHAQRWEGIKT